VIGREKNKATEVSKERVFIMVSRCDAAEEGR
jgi:hypothetical protein